MFAALTVPTSAFSCIVQLSDEPFFLKKCKTQTEIFFSADSIDPTLFSYTFVVYLQIIHQSWASFYRLAGS